MLTFGTTVLVAPALAALRITASLLPVSEAPLKPDTAQSGSLTLAEALEEAKLHNPLLVAAHESVIGARSNLNGQRAPANPTITISNPNTPPPSGPNLKDLATYQFTIPIETNGALQWRTSVARNQLDATKADAETTRATVIQGVKDAYIELQVADAELKNEQQNYDYAKKLSELTEKQFKLGASPETDSIRASIAFTQEESNLLAAQSRVRVAKINLNIQLGRNSTSQIDAAEEIKFVPFDPKLSDLTKLAELNRPELRSAKFNLLLLQATAGLERTQYLPQFYLASDFSQVRNGTLEIGVNIPVDLGSIKGSVRKAEQDAKVQSAQVEQTRLSVGVDVQVAIDGLERTRRILKTYQDGILPRSTSLLERITKSYQLGASTILDILDAQNTYRSVNADYISALGDYNHALSALERAVGGPIGLPTMAQAANEGSPAKSLLSPKDSNR